jgi:tetratricopeptide (TPR) repeat protein
MARDLKKEKTATKKTQAKVISMHRDDNDNVSDEKQTILQQAEAAEKNGDLELAEKLYKEQINQNAFNASVYTRLMIIYRKQKKYKEELQIINKALQHFKEHQEKQLSSKTSNAAIKKLSRSLNKSLGLIDKKGNALYEPEPIPTWKKRKATVEKKLKHK